MTYILLIAGLLLVLYGIKGYKRHEKTGPVIEQKIQSPGGGFDDLLSGSIIIKRLDELENKMDKMASAIYSRNTGICDNPEGDDSMSGQGKYDTGDINMNISMMKRDGMEIEEIAAVTGLTKGEILLRLGMKK